MPAFTWLPANRASTEDVEAVFATGGARRCRCQALKVPGWIWRDTTQEQRDVALLEQTACGTDGPTSGLVGYVDGEAAGWVAVEPREDYPRLWSRKQPWMRMDPELEGVWSVTCFVVGTGRRGSGLTYERGLARSLTDARAAGVAPETAIRAPRPPHVRRAGAMIGG